MAAQTDGERLDRLEQVVRFIAEDRISLQKIVADLATETRRGFEQVAAQFAETDRRMRETDERMRRTDEQMRRTDQRIDQLVLAIGELIRRQNPAQP
jgi:phage tail tape-measure protein